MAIWQQASHHGSRALLLLDLASSAPLRLFSHLPHLPHRLRLWSPQLHAPHLFPSPIQPNQSYGQHLITEHPHLAPPFWPCCCCLLTGNSLSWYVLLHHPCLHTSTHKHHTSQVIMSLLSVLALSWSRWPCGPARPRSRMPHRDTHTPPGPCPPFLSNLGDEHIVRCK